MHLVRDFSLRSLERIAREAGAERVSTTSVKALKEALLEMSNKIAIDAIAATRHAKRVTVKKEDIALVTRK